MGRSHPRRGRPLRCPRTRDPPVPPPVHELVGPAIAIRARREHQRAGRHRLAVDQVAGLDVRADDLGAALGFGCKTVRRSGLEHCAHQGVEGHRYSQRSDGIGGHVGRGHPDPRRHCRAQCRHACPGRDRCAKCLRYCCRCCCRHSSPIHAKRPSPRPSNERRCPRAPARPACRPRKAPVPRPPACRSAPRRRARPGRGDQLAQYLGGDAGNPPLSRSTRRAPRSPLGRASINAGIAAGHGRDAVADEQAAIAFSPRKSPRAAGFDETARRLGQSCCRCCLGISVPMSVASPPSAPRTRSRDHRDSGLAGPRGCIGAPWRAPS